MAPLQRDAMSPDLRQALETLKPFLSREDRGTTSLAPSQRLRDLLAEDQHNDAPPAGLIGRSCATAARQWHLRGFETSSGERRQYHARWLAHLIAPDEIAYLPLVSVVIPVYNRASMIVDAVESCLRQSYEAVEVIVVDDGSTDGLEEKLRPYRGRIRVLGQVHAGVAAARNAGVELASGDFIHFLDSDDLLYPRCIELMIQAFRAIPDAEACYCAFDEVDTRGQPRVSGMSPPSGDRSCPTTDLMNAACSGYPFIVGSVTLPTWICREVGGFEEDLKTNNDRRYWFRLGFRGTKTVGYDRPLLMRRQTLQSLTMNRSAADRSRQIVALRNVLDVVRQPAYWCYVPRAFRGLLHRKTMLGREPKVMTLRGELETEFASLGDGHNRGGLSPLPMLLECRLALDEAAWMFRKKPRAGSDFPERLVSALDSSMRNAYGMTQDDATYWNRCADRNGCGPLPAILRELADHAKDHDIGPALSTLTATARAWAHDRKISRWYAYPDLIERFGVQEAEPGSAWLDFLANRRRQRRRWRVLRARLLEYARQHARLLRRASAGMRLSSR